MSDPMFGPAAELIVAMLGVTVVFFALDVWRRVAEAAHTRGAQVTAAMLLAGWVAVMLIATFVPGIGARVSSVPGSVPALLLAIVAALLWAGLKPAFRHALD